MRCKIGVKVVARVRFCSALEKNIDNLSFLLSLPYLLKTDIYMEYKRQSRRPSEETKARISNSLKGQAKTTSHKEHLSQALKNYWHNDDNFPADKRKKTTIQDIML